MTRWFIYIVSICVRMMMTNVDIYFINDVYFKVDYMVRGFDRNEDLTDFKW